ncbi:AAA domain-containing protein [Arthrobacter sp. HY1533]|uniref:AAA domain-containing protein n=1 Tax=Arthrobacter sp. HY1533 TaxID=2970919 RepID=UPI0022B9D8C0|nr:AAA domain-containing protein [Arthrobacter sp. HY1533]
MTDPRRQAVLVRPSGGGAFADKSSDVLQVRTDPGYTWLTYRSARGEKEYKHRTENVAVVGNPAGGPLAAGMRVAVSGAMWENAVEAWRFDGPDASWWHIVYTTDSGEGYASRPDHEVEFRQDATALPRAADILSYWRRIVAGLAPTDPLGLSYERLGFVDSKSALGSFLSGAAIEPATTPGTLLFPFSASLSQREAVGTCLANTVSVIDGPPGTGKTQTILNLVANIIATPGATVGIVSYNNSAVDNVREKLEDEGFGHVVAGLGRSEKRAEFFEGQDARNAHIDSLLGAGAEPLPAAEQIADVGRRLQVLQETELQLAHLRQEHDAYQLEFRHFQQHFESHSPSGLEGHRLLKRPSGRILDFLAETALSRAERNPVRRLVQGIRRYFQYGSTRGIDPGSTDTVLQLQRAYYGNKINELEQRIVEAEQALANADMSALAQEQRRLSNQALRGLLHRRYAQIPRTVFSPARYKQDFGKFVLDYPVILSTCHSLGNSLPRGFLLDYLIIDESSQVDLLTAGLALKNARNVIVVGDLQQLQHIPDTEAGSGAGPAPATAYDYVQHNILSSMIALHGESLPRTMLREHYRCDPAIISFCNKKFYNGQLVPYTSSDAGVQPLRIVRTTPGNHMRVHHEPGRSNQREIDVVAQEVIKEYFADVDPDKIGIATPYRQQAGKFSEQLAGIQSSTVHKFQGRAKDIVIMSTVLDGQESNKKALDFVDDPHLVNVAVSRAAKQFVLVTTHNMLPQSRNLRDLVHWIQYNNPGQEVVDSTIISVFDLLYRDYSPRLNQLAARLIQTSEFASENIVWTVLQDLLAEDAYTDFVATNQVVLRDLLPDQTRLTADQAAYVGHRATTLDFVIYNRITNRLAFAIEVDGFAFHENNPAQTRRDALKDAICATHHIPLLRLRTTGSGEEAQLRQWLDRSLR